MTQELTVALRIKAFLTEARQAVKGFNQDLKGVGDTAEKVGTQLGKVKPPTAIPTSVPSPPRTPVPAPATAPATAPIPVPVPAPATRPPGSSGISPGQQAMAMRQLPMQITDLATSLASGMPAYMVFIQQGGQIRDSFGGANSALKAMLSLLTPLRVGVGLAAGAVAALVLAYKQGSEEQDAFNRATIMNGFAARATADDLREMARAVDDLVGTEGDAADVLAQLAATGEVARQNLQGFTQAAVQMERVGGQAASETVKQFAELGKAPLQATLKLNESLRHMTASLYDQLQALMRAGQEERAAEVAQAAYARALNERSATLETKLGTLERAWRGVRDLASEAWDAMLNIGRPDTVADQIASQVKVVEELEKRLADRRERGLATGNLGEKLGAARNRLQDLQQDKDEQASLAKTRGEATQVAEAYVKAREANQKYADAALTKQEQLNKRLEEYRRNNEKIRAGGGTISPEQERREEQVIRDEVFGKGFALEAAKARAALQRATLEANLRLLQASIKEGDAIIVQAVEDGNLSIAAAYTARLSQLTTEGEAQRRAYVAEAAEIDKALRSAKTDAERAPLQQQRVEVVARLRMLDSSLADGARQLATWKSDQERELAAITAKVRVDVGGLTGAFDREAVRAQIAESMRGDREAVGRLSDPAETSAAQQRLEMLASAALAQAEFNAKLAEAQRLQQQLSVTEGALQVQQQQGAISQLELEARLRAARAAQLPALQQILQQLQAIRLAMPPEAAAALDSMTRSIGELQNQATAAAPVVTDLGTRLRNTAIDGLADAAAEAVTNFSNLRNSVSSMLKQIAGDILRSGIKQALIDQFSASGGGGTGAGAGGWMGAIFAAGKALFGFADGGLIRGPGTGTSDSIPALVDGRRPIAVSDEEFIQPQRAVKHYGLGFMEAVRTLKLPKPGFAFGGLVAAHQRARYASGGLVAAGAGTQAPNVVFQLVNNGTPQRVTDQRQEFDGKQLVVSVMLDDWGRGGPISQVIRGRN